jgi:hypothetical protein
MELGPRLNSRSRWYTVSLDFAQQHVPHLLCPPNCSHNPCQPPVIYLLLVDPRGRGRPRFIDAEVKVILAEAIQAVQRRGERPTQERVQEQANWPSSPSRLSEWTKRLGYANWRVLVNNLKLPENP